MNYRDKLFQSYGSTHIAYLDSDEAAKQKWFFAYARTNYLPLIGHLDGKRAEVLEIACNRGYLLLSLSKLGFQNLRGIDLSPEDIAHARTLLPQVELSCLDVFTYLEKTRDQFDLIIMKAMLEHLPKNDVLGLLQSIRSALRPEGMALIDVPNMDWLMATHERYMDFTHEVGFTRESLAQVMRNVFPKVSTQPGKLLAERGFKGRIIGWLRPCVIAGGQVVLRILGEGASDTWWYSRSIIAVGEKEDKNPDAGNSSAN